MNLKNKLAISTFVVAATLSVAEPVKAEWLTYTTSDGLASTSVHAVLEDRHGNIWVGTQDGLSRYDGVQWKTFTTKDGLADDTVYSLLVDGSGDLWIGTRDGICRYDGRDLTTYKYPGPVGRSTVRAIVQDSSGDMWFGGGFRDGVFRFDGENWTQYTTADGLAGDTVFAMLEDNSGDLWFGTDYGGVSRFDGVSWTTFTEIDGLADDSVNTIIEDTSGKIWVGTSGGVSRFDGFSWTTYTTADGLARDAIKAIYEDSSGSFWFGGLGGGVTEYDGVTWRVYSKEEGLADNFVVAILEDSSGHMWFGTYYGLSRYDGVSWKIFTREDGLIHDAVFTVLEDSWGAMWFGTVDGISRFDGVSWTSYDNLSSLYWISSLEDSQGNLWFGSFFGSVIRYDGDNWEDVKSMTGRVYTILEDSSGDLWFGTGGGVERYNGVDWTKYTTNDGLVSDIVTSICEDRSGSLWFGTFSRGVSVFDGASWDTVTVEDGLASNEVTAIVEDKDGNLWFGTDGEGVCSYDGVSWKNYTSADGMLGNSVDAMIQDSKGVMWLGTIGVSRFDGSTWATYTPGDGLARGGITSICEDSDGNLWFGSGRGGGDGVTRHEPDRKGPETVIWPEPPALTSSTNQTIIFVAAFGETDGIKFSYSFDWAPWSRWTTVNSWTGNGLEDGEHTFRVRSRDRAGNVDSSAAVAVFTVDATPPTPLLLSPYSGQALQDSVQILGSAADSRFRSYLVEARSLGAEAWEHLTESHFPISDGVLCGWNTAPLPDGDYEIRLSVTDTLGLTGAAVVRVVVDNEAPWAYETTPAVIRYGTGGDVYTKNREAHLYFPPNGFVRDTEVRIEELGEMGVPDTLAGGAVRVLAGYEVIWGDSLLAKAATLELSYEGMEFNRDAGPGAYPDVKAFAIYRLDSESKWRRVGGTVDGDAMTISSSIAEPGWYSVFSGGQAGGAGAALSALSITPRVFSPTGGFSSRQAAIGFTLGRPGPVTVKIYNRAGRLVSEVISGEQLNAGANLVYWCGRDREGDLVEDGVYLVTVEASGQKQVKPLAVVR